MNGAKIPCANIRYVVYLYMNPQAFQPFGCDDASVGFVHFVAIGGMTVNSSTTVSVRKASIIDIEKLYEIIQGYAKQGIMLPRTREMLEEQIDSFVVAEHDGTLIGCGSLTRLGPDLVEIRSLGMTRVSRDKELAASWLISWSKKQEAKAL